MEEPRPRAPSALVTNLGLFIIALIAAGLKAYYEGASPAEGKVERALIDVFLAFCALELGYLIVQAHGLREAFEKAGKKLADRSGRDALLARLDERVCEVREVLDTDDPVYSSVAKAAFRPLNDFKLTPSGLVIDTEQLTISFYAEFWKELVERQHALQSRYFARPLTIYTTHSASIRLWRRPEFAEVRALQDRFVSLGGIVHRVLINQSRGIETPDEYEQAVAEMTHARKQEVSQGHFNMFYLERDDHNVKTDDFLLTVLDDKPYCATWVTGWHGGYGSIVRCQVRTDPTSFKEHWQRWCEIVSEAAAWQPPEHFEQSALRARPSRKLAARMTKMPPLPSPDAV